MSKAHINTMIEHLINNEDDQAAQALHCHIAEVISAQDSSELGYHVIQRVDDFLTKEINELKDDIASFRDLELEMSQALVKAKIELANQFKSDLKDLVERVDSFLEQRIAAELRGH